MLFLLSGFMIGPCFIGEELGLRSVFEQGGILPLRKDILGWFVTPMEEYILGWFITPMEHMEGSSTGLV